MSLLLDTNVLSELMSAVTQAEMLFGAALLPAGRRRTTLEASLRAMFDEDFAQRVLPFDGAAASMCAQMATARRRAGRPMSQFDAQIAAIATSRSLRLATRNTADFEGCGVRLVDPWQATTA